ncbi:MAG: diguanylate cyclase [Thermoleophilaceae bacterium]
MPGDEILIQQQQRPASTSAALAAVRRLSFAALEAEEAGAIHAELARELLYVFGIDQVHVTRVDRTAGRSYTRSYRPGADGEPEIGSTYSNELSGSSAVERVTATGAPHHEPDARGSKVLSQELVARFDAASALFLPLSYHGDVPGVVTLVSERERHFSEAEGQLAYTLANQASAGLAALDMRRRLAARADRQTALARATAALNARLDRRAVLEALCREASLAVGADFTGVYLGDARAGAVAVAAHGIDDDDEWFGNVIRGGERLAGRVLETGSPATSEDYRGEFGLPGLGQLDRVLRAISVPVRWGEALRGVLSVGFYSHGSVDDDDIEILQAVADLAGAACDNAEAYELTQRAARTDSLTGLLNHGAVQMRLGQEIARARRTGDPLACLLIDLDDFKPVNDAHGHLVGDRVLRRVADAVTSEFRTYDAIGRFGGDEFVMVLPGADEAAAQETAARLRRAIATGGADGPGTVLTASVGSACWHEPLNAAELLDRADRALLVAKRRGKDCLVAATAEVESELVQLEVDAGPVRFVSELWDLVSQCERPRDVLDLLPFYLRRALEVEEIALYAPPQGLSGAYPLERRSHARLPSDPSPPAFRARQLALQDAPTPTLGTGAISRPLLGDLHAALGLGPDRLGTEAVAGSYAAVSLVRDGELHGILLMRSAALRFPLPTMRLAQLLAGQAVTALIGQTGGASRSAVGALAAAIDARDNYTHDHSEQVVWLALRTAKLLELPASEVERVRDGAMLHDVGKVAIPNEILYKPGALDAAEWAIMREHPVIGERILRRTPELATIAPLVRHEHERWDGAGYPDGLAGPAIPIGSRILLACDAYNAMITARPYREPMSGGEAVAELERNAGSQFDPQVVAALLGVLASDAEA